MGIYNIYCVDLVN